MDGDDIDLPAGVSAGGIGCGNLTLPIRARRLLLLLE